MITPQKTLAEVYIIHVYDNGKDNTINYSNETQDAQWRVK